MIRLAAVTLWLALHAGAASPAGLQDPLDAESKFKALLDRVEKAGLAVPDLPEGAAELEKILPRQLPKDLRDRHAVVRAQAAVLSSLHAQFLKSKGGLLEIPVPPGKAVLVKIVDVLKKSLKISRAEVVQDLPYAELDAEWALATAKPSFASERDAALWSGLWLAKAARWDAALVALTGVDTDHPLAVETRKRALESAVAAFDALVKSKRWMDALSRLDTLENLSPGDDRLKSARGRLLDAMVEQGKEHCRKKAKGPMQEIIDLIAKHFPDGADRMEDIREANRWVKITDPKKFKRLDAAKGPPWLVTAPADGAHTMYTTETDNDYVGLSVKFHFEKGEKKAQGGFVWEDGHRIAWVSAESANVCVASGKPGEVREAHNYASVTVEGSHTIVLRIRNGKYVLQHNGDEYDTMEAKQGTIGAFALNACYGKVWIDEVQVLKKE